MRLLLFGTVLILVLIACVLTETASENGDGQNTKAEEENLWRNPAWENPVQGYLFTGRYEEAERMLSDLLKQNPEKDRQEELGRIRRDLVLLKALSSSDPGSVQSFETPEAAFSAVCFASAAKKTELLIDQDSEVLPPADVHTAAKEVFLSNREKKERLDKVNSHLSKDRAYPACSCYRAVLFGAEYEVFVVMERETFRYRPYSLFRLDGTRGASVALVKQMLREQPDPMIFSGAESFRQTEEYP